MANEMTTADMEILARAGGGLLLQLQESQQRANDAVLQHDLEKFRIAVAEREKAAERAFRFMLSLLFLAAVAIGTLLYLGQYQFAYQAMMFIFGLFAGYGLGRSRPSQ
jgi:hypothetical protein